MDTPIFKLENVIKTSDDYEDFTGPLTLILQLLTKDKVEIRDISVSKILDQYLDYLDQMAEMDLEVASEFVAMASHLVYIKTKMLLTNDEEISELEQLISSLEQLQKRDILTKIQTVIDELGTMYSRGAGLISKPPEFLPVDTEYKYKHESRELFEAMMKIIKSNDGVIEAARPTTIAFPKKIVYSIAAKADTIIQKLKQYGTMRISAFLYEEQERASVVAAFIAILELCSTGSVLITGTDEDLSITYTGTGDDTVSDDYSGES